ncbi:vesicle-associated membrane protein 7-like [Bolinopsis microptera]|uniref:vesicle-associated membrane protein 7-like n=1 Tax=Bolinopsis microptera TaxID=2820187 RepID=UPI00307A712F
MSIYYAVVARKTTILTKCAQYVGNFDEVTNEILRKVDRDGKLTYTHEKYLFHYIASDMITYLCITDEDFPRSKAFSFLGDIMQRFERQYGTTAKTALPYAMDSDFNKVLQNQMRYYTNNPESGTISKVQNEIDDLKQIMVKNIDSLSERGERIELLVNKAEDLTNQSTQFQRQSRDLRRAMFWKNVKMYLLIGGIGFAIFWIILSISCGGLGIPKCR